MLSSITKRRNHELANTRGDKMSLQVIDCIQGSDEWLQARLGCITGTGFKDVLNKKEGRGKYMLRLLAERMTGQPTESYTNANMERGTELEPQAREAYELYKGVKVHQVGFVKSEEHIGCSPDGFVGDDGMIQIKCPLASTHCGYIIKNQFPTTYNRQVQGELWITGRAWSDFVSYHPDMSSQKIWVVRVYPDLKLHKEMETACKDFLAELADMQSQILAPY
jgi:hypothetical protein